MKKILCIMLSFSLLLFGNSLTINASENTTTEIDYLADGSFIVTEIEVEPNNSLISALSTSVTVTATKKSTYKNASGTTLWSVAVTGKFTYVKGKSSTCTSSTVSTTAPASTWKISVQSASKSGNKATAKATATQYIVALPVGSITETVTLTCSINGVLS